jgi:predicted amidophosphoribosyltransferase
LCDDVYTTGSTVNACAKCLKDMGAKKVIAACIAYTKPAETHNEES